MDWPDSSDLDERNVTIRIRMHSKSGVLVLNSIWPQSFRAALDFFSGAEPPAVVLSALTGEALQHGI